MKTKTETCEFCTNGINVFKEGNQSFTETCYRCGGTGNLGNHTGVWNGYRFIPVYGKEREYSNMNDRYFNRIQRWRKKNAV